MTVADVVREVAAEFGRTLTDDQLEYVLWEETGYPCFWPDSTKTPEENLRAQVREFFQKERSPVVSLDEAMDRAMRDAPEAFGE